MGSLYWGLVLSAGQDARVESLRKSGVSTEQEGSKSTSSSLARTESSDFHTQPIAESADTVVAVGEKGEGPGEDEQEKQGDKEEGEEEGDSPDDGGVTGQENGGAETGGVVGNSEGGVSPSGEGGVTSSGVAS